MWLAVSSRGPVFGIPGGARMMEGEASLARAPDCRNALARREPPALEPVKRGLAAMGDLVASEPTVEARLEFAERIRTQSSAF
jgi:hypothetical protein